MMPDASLADSQIIPDAAGSMNKTTAIVALALALLQKTFPNAGNANTELPTTQLAKAPTVKATSVAQAAAITP